MNILNITLKDLSQITRDWRSFAFLLVSPIIFTLFFGLVFGGTDGGEASDPRLPVGWADEDHSAFSARLLEQLESSEVLRLETEDEAAALEKLVAEEKLAAALIIPAGFGQALMDGNPQPLTFIADTASTSSVSVQTEVQSAANRLISAVVTANLGVAMFEQQQGFTDEAARQAYLNEALRRAFESQTATSVTVEVTTTGQSVESTPAITNAYAHSSPGMMAQFAIAGLMGAAEIIVRERKSRALQRLMTTAVTRMEVLLGHFLAMFTMILAQYVLLIAFGQLFLGLRYSTSWAATLLVTLAMALAAAGMGLFIGAIAKTEEQVIIMTLIPMFVFAGLGGAWVPLEFTPPAIQSLGHITPVAWMMDGFKNILIRGQGLSAALLPAGALLAFAVGFFGLGVWRFRVE